MDHIQLTDFEEWQADNQPFFVKVDVDLILDLVLEFFEQKKAPFRRCQEAKRESLSIEERIIKGNEFFDPGYFAQYLPHEGDQIGLFLRLLHHNLPMHSVDPVWKPKLGKRLPPTNATEFQFVSDYMGRFRKWVGDKPSLWTWQQETEAFLLYWCPPGKQNGFKWKDSTREDGNWTLTAEECKQIAYVTTYQYAHVLLQHDAIASPGPTPSGDGLREVGQNRMWSDRK